MLSAVRPPFIWNANYHPRRLPSNAYEVVPPEGASSANPADRMDFGSLPDPVQTGPCR